MDHIVEKRVGRKNDLNLCICNWWRECRKDEDSWNKKFNVE
jgi:hypothetical protein